MSGGVDSSVAAALLKDEGYEVVGITMQIWPADQAGEGGSCCSLSAVEDARRVCHKLGIKHYVMNFRKDFEKAVNELTAKGLKLVKEFPRKGAHSKVAFFYPTQELELLIEICEAYDSLVK